MQDTASTRGLRPRAFILASFVGFIVGVPLIVGLALVGEAVGIGGAQGIVGAAIGIGVGALQARALRGLLARPTRWFWATVVGAAVPFGLADVARLLGASDAYSLYACVALAGVLIGALQSRLLPGPRWRWVVASTVGWTLAGGGVALADVLQKRQALHGIGGLVAYLALVLSGGAVLGAITGPVLARTLR